MTFIDRLLALMDERNITAYRLSKDIGISESLIRHWETKPKTDPSATKVLKISEYFQVTMKWLLTGQGDKEFPYADSPPVKEPVVATEDVTAKEKLLLDNFRDSTDKGKNELLCKSGDIVLRSGKKQKRLLTSLNTADATDLELGSELA